MVSIAVELSQKKTITFDFEGIFSPEIFSSDILSTLTFPRTGKNSKRWQHQLENILDNDIPYNSGQILGAMSTPPHEIAAKLYSKYIEKNIGDRGLNPGTAKLENHLVTLMGNLLGAENSKQFGGNMTSGGTESNLIAINLAKTLQPHIQKPNIVISEAAHYSFEKISHLMNIELRYAPILPDLLPDMAKFEALINDNTIALVGIAGTSALGLVDPIDKMAKLARNYNKFLHVDGAFGGFVLPFLEKLGMKYPLYDFRLPEVSTFSVDPHKMGMNINPSGLFLARNNGLDHRVDNVGFQIPYLAGGGHQSFNILGTRPGAPVIAFWGLIQYMGFDGFMQIMKKSWNLTLLLQDYLSEISQLRIVAPPQMNVLGIQFSNPNKNNTRKLNQKLRDRGWYLGHFDQWDLLRFVMMPHVTSEHLASFIVDLKQILRDNF
ncbi:MAG: tyrosine decarboxylase MfnA [Promethearchaeota archaeon]